MKTSPIIVLATVAAAQQDELPAASLRGGRRRQSLFPSLIGRDAGQQPHQGSALDGLLAGILERGDGEGGNFLDKLDDLRDNMGDMESELDDFKEMIANQRSEMAKSFAHMGDGMGMMDLLASMLDSIGWGNLTCPLSGSDLTLLPDPEPECAYNARGDQGVWVCRNLTNPFTGEHVASSVCSHENYTIGAVDTCGCCNGVCPTPCGCPCEYADGVMGVRTLMSVSLFGRTMEYEMCMESAVAVSVVGYMDHMSCVSNCSAPIKDYMPPFFDDLFGGDSADEDAENEFRPNLPDGIPGSP